MMPTKLADWMSKNGYTNSSLAKLLGFGREVVWTYATGKQSASDRFKWRFAETFGTTVAAEVFEVPQVQLQPETEPAQ